MPHLHQFHERIGHPSFNTAQKALKQSQIYLTSLNKENMFCKQYDKTKSHKLPFVSSHPKDEKLFLCCI